MKKLTPQEVFDKAVSDALAQSVQPESAAKAFQEVARNFNLDDSVCLPYLT